MAWSTKQVAELAGTTVKAVRHYHEIGLLAEPERLSNGYKLYEVRHLVSLLRITRLTDLNVPLAQIAAMDLAGSEVEETLRSLDGELEASAARLTRVRAELALILDHESSTEMPAGVGPAVPEMSEADRSLLLVYSRLFGLSDLRDLRQNLVDLRQDSAHAEFDELPADADETTRKALAEAYAQQLRRHMTRFPWMSDPAHKALRSPSFIAETVGQALENLYNAAQLDVLARVNTILAADRSG
ncbi:MerR family DNA-binding transcriptional regulator [Herbiconiux sp.]|uniref:MerR family DNA-binding transcriptional regulator n=1 Tax=Herbiconiux sp. TaxID=1871186 RepID=UPI0025BFF6EA|nr:MerR family DNA-binding transcriptional regulator [Herbiconiux sp.]